MTPKNLLYLSTIINLDQSGFEPEASPKPRARSTVDLLARGSGVKEDAFYSLLYIQHGVYVHTKTKELWAILPHDNDRS